MITLQPITEAAWTTAQAWRTSPWAVPRVRATSDLPYDPDGDPYVALVTRSRLCAVAGFVDGDRLPPGTVRLTLWVAPTDASQYQLRTYVRLAVEHAFETLDYTAVLAEVVRDADVPTLVPTWQWIADVVTRDLGGSTHDEQTVASGGWWFESDGISKINPDTASPLYLHWVRR